MSADGQPAVFLESREIPQTTPRPERQRLAAKGQMLAEHCLEGGGTACVIGFVEHCLGKSPPQLDVILDLWRELHQEYARRLGAAQVEDAQRLVLLQELLHGVTSGLNDALRRMTDPGRV